MTLPVLLLLLRGLLLRLLLLLLLLHLSISDLLPIHKWKHAADGVHSNKRSKLARAAPLQQQHCCTVKHRP